MEEPKPQKKAFSPVHRGGGVGGGTQKRLASLPKQLGLWWGFAGGNPAGLLGPGSFVSFLGALQKHHQVRGLGHEMPTTAGLSGVCGPHSLAPPL